MAGIRDQRRRKFLAGGSAYFYDALQPHLTWSTDIVEVPVLIHIDRSSVAKGQATPVNELENLPKEDVKKKKTLLSIRGSNASDRKHKCY